MLRVATASSKHILCHNGRRTNSLRTPTLTTSTALRYFSNNSGSSGSFLWESSNSSSGDGSEEKGSGNATKVVVPSKLGVGDSAPRYPHVLGLPVVTRPLFPGVFSSVSLSDPATISALENAGNRQGYVGVFLRKSADKEVIIHHPEVITDPDELYKVGTFCQIHKVSRNTQDPAGGDSANVVLFCHRRIDLVSVDNLGPPVDLTVSHWDRLDKGILKKSVDAEAAEAGGGGDSDDDDDGNAKDILRALSNEIWNTMREVAQMNPLFRENVQFFPPRFDPSDPYRLADIAASVTTGAPKDLQAVLEERDAEMRLHKALVLLKKEREVSMLQKEISAKVEEQMTEAQRKYFLTEQLKSIKKELGLERDDKDALIEKFREKLTEYPDIPKEVMETIDAELEKLSTLEKNSSEFNVTRSYLDWLTTIPWGVMSEEKLDLAQARKVLDRDHYGLQEVKDTILQFIAVGKLKGTVQGKILCLAGPPGTGKTSVAESVADALGRKFFRFSVGGLSDVSEIKGHRRTYVGAMPGKIIQCLKSTGTSNPLVLIDEIDKLGSGYRGDPASALLEVLDPSQNSTFRDHFLDVPVDISKVLFMCTANDISQIPGPLLDRMEIVRLSGYDFPEKVAIADQYLVPKLMRENGLMMPPKRETGEGGGDEVAAAEEEEKKEDAAGDDKNVVEDEKAMEERIPFSEYVTAENVPESLSIAPSAIESLVRWYCREAGVRNLSKHIDKIARKLALQVVAEQEGIELPEKSARKSDTWEVDEGNLEQYVGKPIFTSDRLYEKDPLPNGICMGLAWTSMGGSALYVETQGIQRGEDPEGKKRGGGTIKVTGQLGDVMKESTQIAYTVARARLAEMDPANHFFDEDDIHIHVPEGATPKDGPSAGVTMVTAMLSLAMGKPVRNDLAMTGEISLTGKVMAVGGIKEKTMAARRAGISCIVFPAANKRDFDEMPDYLKEGLDVHYAEEYSTVFDVAFSHPGDDTTPSSSLSQ